MKNEAKDLLLRSDTFAQSVVRLYSVLPKGGVMVQVLGKQVLRSGTFVGAN